MTMDDITARPISLDSLLDGIGKGTVVLPDFQRDFDWGRPAVVSLVATVLSSWPAGSLLVMRGAPDFFAVREFEDAPTRAARVDYVVLDGQQRLTSLYHALRGAGPAVYALRVHGLDGPDVAVDAVEEAMVVCSLDQWIADYPLSRQGRDGVVPLAALRSPSSFFEWRDDALAQVPSDLREEQRRLLTRAYKNLLGKANEYFFPSVLLETSLPPEAVARIFERVNRTGLKLGTFDLLVARTYERHWNLRDKWEAARRDADHLDRYLGEDGTPLLQTIGLRYVDDVRQPALLKLSKSIVHDRWEGTVTAFEAALAFVHDVCGVTEPEWLPYQTQLLPLAALAMDHDLDRHADILQAWFWGRSLSQHYDVGSSTKAVSDYAELRGVLAGDRTVTAAVIRLDDLREATRRQSGATWRTFLSLLLQHTAIDPITGVPPEDRVVASLLPREGSEKDALHQRVLSQVIVERTTAKLFRNVGLLPAFQQGTAEAIAAAASQFVPLDGADGQSLIRDRARSVADYAARGLGADVRLVDAG